MCRGRTGNRMVSPTGFEPVTPRLGIWCSILLSYEDVPAYVAQTAIRRHTARAIRGRSHRERPDLDDGAVGQQQTAVRHTPPRRGAVGSHPPRAPADGETG